MKFGKKLTLLLTLASAFISFNSKAQYGNEWINYDQTYYKIKIGAEGIYRIDFQTLSDIGVPVSTLNPKNFQLFLNGEELHIYVGGEADEVFDSTDFIEFYGNKNDGRLDKELYRTPEEHTNPYYSLYSDTSIYFLTWNGNTANRRIVDYNDNNFIGKIPDDYFVHTSVNYYKNTFVTGIPVNNDQLQTFSEYTDGEGWVQNIGGMPLYTYSLPGIYTAGPSSEIEIRAYGANHDKSQIQNNANHNFAVALNTKTNILTSIKTLGFEAISLKQSINSANLLESTKFYIGEITYPNSRFNLSYVNLTYPRKFDLVNNPVLLINASLTSSYLRFINYSNTKTKPIVYDFVNHDRITPSYKSPKTIEFNLRQVGSNSVLYLTDISNITNISSQFISKCQMNLITLSSETDYLIISNEKLKEGAENYKRYRESNAGRNFTTQISYVQDIYNNYFFGYEHPLAIERYIRSFSASSSNLKHILFLGKGQTYNRIRNNVNLKEAYNLVPVIGIPGSDMLYVSSLNSSSLKPKFSIGRIPASTNEQISNYLEKLEAFEFYPSSDVKKKIIQLAGGVNPAENTQFVSFLNDYHNIAADTNLGAYRVLFSKTDPVPVQSSIEKLIQNEINDGSIMLSYFGHGAAQVTEISFGEAKTLNNFGKTPLFIFNGCALANTFEDISLAEQFLFEKQKGVLGWIASTNFGFTFSLYNHTKEIYKQLFQINYDGTVGEAMKDALNFYGNPNNTLDVLQSRQFIYHGDPALKIFSPEKPDYKISVANIGPQINNLDSSTVKISIQNSAKALDTSLTYKLEVFDPSNNKIFEIMKYTSAPHYLKNEEFNIPSKLLKGLLTFKITLDPLNDIEELDPVGETNNSYSFQYLFQQKAPEILFPQTNSIISSNVIDFIIQIPGSDKNQKVVSMEWDTTPHFNKYLGKEEFSTSNHIINKSLTFPLKNDQDYYVRCKYTENGKESDWVYTTFGVIANEPEGWTQGNNWKFEDAKKNFIEVDTLHRQFNFSRTFSEQYKFEPGGDDIGQFGMSRWIIIDGWPAMYGWWPANGVNLMVIDNNNGKRYMEDSDYNQNLPTPWAPFPAGRPYTVTGEKCGVYHYNTNDSITQDSLAAFLNRIPENFHLIMINAYNCDVPNWKQSLWDQLNNFGIVDLKSVKKGEPFGIIAVKNSTSPMKATEYLADYNSITPPRSQRTEKGFLFQPYADSGYIESMAVGPSLDWTDLSIDFSNLETSDSFSVDIYGSPNKASWNKLISNSYSNKISLNSIDPVLYPYIKFRVRLFDEENRSSPTIKRWKINYKGPTEGLINYDIAYDFKSDTIPEGEDLLINLAFSNISKQKYDSSNYIIYTRNAQNNFDTLVNKSFQPIASQGYIITRDTIKTKGLKNKNDLYVSFNPNHNVVESNYSNNVLYKEFYVQKDNKNPILDVIFDGNHIMDNDIVSPNTLITISVIDENTYLYIDKEGYIKATLKHPDEKVDSLTTKMNNVIFTPSTGPESKAKLEYQASELPTGNYELSVFANDASNNLSSENQLKINFQVVGETTITNFYPYPNPFTTNTRFVYTLTGDKLPDYLKIQILNVSGKVVREITQSELGEIKIGNNISEYAWDGTDEFGDKLANGVYLYKVIAKLNNEEILNRETSGDSFFANGYGKLYLMR